MVEELMFICQPSTDTQWVTYNTIEDKKSKTLTLSIKEFKEEKIKLNLTPREYINYLISK